VGALAVALGISAAVATMPGVAWADGSQGTDGTTNPPVQEKDAAAETGSDATKEPKTPKPDIGEVIRHNLDQAAKDIRKALTGTVRGPVGTQRTSHGTLNKKPNISEDIDDREGALEDVPPAEEGLRHDSSQNRNQNPLAPQSPNRTVTRQFSQTATGALARIQHNTVEVTGDAARTATRSLAPLTINRSEPGVAVARATLVSEDTPATPQITAAPEPGPVVRIVSGFLAAIGFGPSANNSPNAPVSGPTLIGALGLIRREIEHLFVNKTPDVASTPTSLTVDQDDDTTFTVPVLDADGDRLTYTVTDEPDHGDITLVGSTATTYTYRYTADDEAPTAATIDDHFTLTANDAAAGFHFHGLASLFNPQGAHTDSVTVNVDIVDANVAPVVTLGTPVHNADNSTTVQVTITDPNGDTFSPVASVPDGTGTVVITPIANTPGSYTVVYKPDRTYALGLTANTPVTVTVSATDTAAAPKTGTATAPAVVSPVGDNEIVGVVEVGHGAIKDTAFSPDGSKAYVANDDGTVSVIDAMTNKVIDTNSSTSVVDPITLPPGQKATAVAVSPDSTRLYVATADAATGAGQLWVYDTTTYAQIDANPGADNAIGVPLDPSVIAVQGNRIFVGGGAAGSGSVTVISADTAANTYSVVGSPFSIEGRVLDVATSPTVLYVIMKRDATSDYTFLQTYSLSGDPNAALPQLMGAGNGGLAPFHSFAAAPQPDAGLVATGESFLNLHANTVSGKFGSEVTDFAIAGNRIYAGVANGSVLVIDRYSFDLIDADPNEAGTNAIELPADVTPTDVATKPNGGQVYVAGSDGKIYVVKVYPANPSINV
jgi:WD40 repeat protein